MDICLHLVKHTWSCMRARDSAIRTRASSCRTVIGTTVVLSFCFSRACVIDSLSTYHVLAVGTPVLLMQIG